MHHTREYNIRHKSGGALAIKSLSKFKDKEDGRFSLQKTPGMDSFKRIWRRDNVTQISNIAA